MSTPKRQSMKDYIAAVQAQATEHFANHLIRSRTSNSWTVQRPGKSGGWDGTFSFEVIASPYHGSLYVHGDIDCVRFAQYVDSGEPERILRWMGGTRDLGYYVLQKATIGMCLPRSGRDVLEVLDEGVWLDRALDYAEDRRGVIDDDGKMARLDPVRDMELLPGWMQPMVRELLDGGNIDEMLGDNRYMVAEAYDASAYEWGLVPSWRLINAHEALRKLVQLLDAEHAAQAEDATSAVDTLWRTVVIAALAAMRGQQHERNGGCYVCGSTAKRSAGECDNCGTYRCTTCKRLHYGDATQPCDGHGVEVPDASA